MSSLKFCTHCGAKLAEGAANCSACRKSVALMLGALAAANPNIEFKPGNFAPASDLIKELIEAKILTSTMPSTRIQGDSTLASLIRSGHLARGLNTSTNGNYPFIVAVIRANQDEHSNILSSYIGATKFKHDTYFSSGDTLVIASTAGPSEASNLDAFLAELQDYFDLDDGTGEVESAATEDGAATGIEPAEAVAVVAAGAALTEIEPEPQSEPEATPESEAASQPEPEPEPTPEPEPEPEPTPEPEPEPEPTPDPTPAGTETTPLSDVLEVAPVQPIDVYDDAFSLLDIFAENGLVEDIDDEPHYLSPEASQLWSNGQLASFVMAETDEVQPSSVRVVIESSSGGIGIEAMLENEDVKSSRSFETSGWSVTLLALTVEDRPKLPKLEAAIKGALSTES